MARTFLAIYPQGAHRLPPMPVCGRQDYLWPCQRVKLPEGRLKIPRVVAEMFRDLHVRRPAGAVTA